MTVQTKGDNIGIKVASSAGGDVGLTHEQWESVKSHTDRHTAPLHARIAELEQENARLTLERDEARRFLENWKAQYRLAALRESALAETLQRINDLASSTPAAGKVEQPQQICNLCGTKIPHDRPATARSAHGICVECEAKQRPWTPAISGEWKRDNEQPASPPPIDPSAKPQEQAAGEQVVRAATDHDFVSSSIAYRCAVCGVAACDHAKQGETAGERMVNKSDFSGEWGLFDHNGNGPANGWAYAVFENETQALAARKVITAALAARPEVTPLDKPDGAGFWGYTWKGKRYATAVNKPIEWAGASGCTQWTPLVDPLATEAKQ